MSRRDTTSPARIRQVLDERTTLDRILALVETLSARQALLELHITRLNASENARAWDANKRDEAKISVH